MTSFVEVANTQQLNGTLSTFDGRPVQRPTPAIELYGAVKTAYPTFAGAR